jgi:imidazoleglycerol phosphate synthase glutamine amidotransferase subunit HisH
MNIIIDHKLGNIFSIYSACKFLGHKCKISSSVEEIKSASKIIIPSVGHIANNGANYFSTKTKLIVEKLLSN